jgi:hypothetical protein
MPGFMLKMAAPGSRQLDCLTVIKSEGILKRVHAYKPH